MYKLKVLMYDYNMQCLDALRQKFCVNHHAGPTLVPIQALTQVAKMHCDK